jgi:hypothetical protein
MRDYAVVSPKFWTGPTGRALKARGAQYQVFALYLMTNPSANMIGLYYLPIPTIAHEVGQKVNEIQRGFDVLSELDFAFYDRENEIVWIPQMAHFQIGENLKEADKRITGIKRELKRYEHSKYASAFLAKYGTPYRLPADLLTFQGATKGLARDSEGDGGSGLQDQDQDQLQDQDQDHDQKQDSFTPEQSSVALPSPDSRIVVELLLNDKSKYQVVQSRVAKWKGLYPAVDVEQELREMVGWCDSNPKKRKTRSGIEKFITGWLAREQDDAPAKALKSKATSKSQPKTLNGKDYAADFDESALNPTWATESRQ